AASKASNFWCGTQIQNIPEYAKSQLIADIKEKREGEKREEEKRKEEEWELCELDKKASESFTTAYLSQDKNLLNVLHNSPDFHCTNASLFCGIPFEELFANGKVLNKPIRTITHTVNHAT